MRRPRATTGLGLARRETVCESEEERDQQKPLRLHFMVFSPRSSELSRRLGWNLTASRAFEARALSRPVGLRRSRHLRVCRLRCGDLAPERTAPPALSSKRVASPISRADDTRLAPKRKE
jgi:hypothetical protein